MYSLRCDNAACGDLVDEGPGQPALSGKPRLFCNRCATYVEQVEAQLRVEMTRFAHEGVERLNKRRAELMAQMLPAGRGGTGEGFQEWPQVG